MLLAIALASASSPLPVGMTIFGGKRGSAFLISNCEILTAKHVLPRRHAVPGLRGRFRIHGREIRAQIVAVGPGAASTGGRRRGDWAVARLDRCVGQRFGYFRLPSARPSARVLFNRPLAMAGIPGGHGLLSTSQGCAAWAILPDDTLQLNCRVELGQSGGPVFVRDGETGALTALAIISARSPGTAISFAAELPDLGPFGPFRTILSKMEETRTALR